MALKIANTKRELFVASFIGGFFCLVFSSLMGTTFTYTYDNATPVGTDAPSTLDDQDRNTKLANRERNDVDHYWELTGTQVSDAATGEHRKISFHSQIADPTNAADKGFTYMKDASGNTELFWMDELGNVKQLTSVGQLNVTGSEVNGLVANNTYLTAIDAAGTGTVDLIKADANDVAVVPDNSQTATNAAPTSSTGIANKKFVEDQIAAQDLFAITASGATINSSTMSVANTFQDLDISGTVGAVSTLCFLKVTQSGGSGADVVIRPNGESEAFSTFGAYAGATDFNFATSGQYGYCTCMTDSGGVLEVAANSASVSIIVKLIAYLN